MFTKNKVLGGYGDKQRLKYSKFAASARIAKCTAAVALKMCSWVCGCGCDNYKGW